MLTSVKKIKSYKTIGSKTGMCALTNVLGRAFRDLNFSQALGTLLWFFFQYLSDPRELIFLSACADNFETLVQWEEKPLMIFCRSWPLSLTLSSFESTCKLLSSLILDFSLPLHLKAFWIWTGYGTELRKKIPGCLVKTANWKCLIGVKVEELCIKCLWKARSLSGPLWNTISWIVVSYLHWKWICKRALLYSYCENHQSMKSC